MANLTKKNKITIAVSVISAAVLVFSITMFAIWANVEINCKDVSYATLQKEFGNYFIVPSGLEDQISGTCRVHFPDADPDSNHRYAKYTNITIKNKYATRYNISLNRQDVGGYIFADKEYDSDLSVLLSVGYQVSQTDGVDVYYKQSIEETASFKYYKRISMNIKIEFVLDGVLYIISMQKRAEGESENGIFIDENLQEDCKEQVNEYARYLFDKFFSAQKSAGQI